MTEPRTVKVGQIEIANDRPFALIAGPCQIESREHAIEVAGFLSEACGKAGIAGLRLVLKGAGGDTEAGSRSSPRSGGCTAARS